MSLSRDRIYRRATLACLGGVLLGGVLAVVFPWGGLPLVLVSAFTGWAFWEQGRRADAIVQKISLHPEDHLLELRQGPDRAVLGLSGLFQHGELCDFVNGYRVEGVRLVRDERTTTLELHLGSRTGRPMPVLRRLEVPAGASPQAEQAARRLAAYYECPLEE
jgi:hypothetical protein